MNTALFINIDTIPFTGYWNGKPKTFKPGQEKYMPDFLARHFAKHLTNKLLHDAGKDTCTSPKFPEQVPAFMELFNRCYKPEVDDLESDLDVDIDIANRQEPSLNIPAPKKKLGRPPKAEKIDGLSDEPQMIAGPDDDEFEGLK